MTQEELAKKWADKWRDEMGKAISYPTPSSVKEVILAALKEQEKIHPWADAEERYKQVLDDFQGLAAQEPDHFNRVYISQDTLKTLKGWKDRVIDALIVTWAYKKEHEDDPKQAIADLVTAEIQYAMDARVSKEMYEKLRAAFNAGAAFCAGDKPGDDLAAFEDYLRYLADNP
jgi:hypothetical protein